MSVISLVADGKHAGKRLTIQNRVEWVVKSDCSKKYMFNILPQVVITDMGIISYFYKFARDSEYERNHVWIRKRDVIRSSPDYRTVLRVKSFGFFVDLPIPSHGNVIEPHEGRWPRNQGAD